MALTVDIQLHDKKWKTVLTQKAVRAACAAGFRDQGSADREVTIVFASDAFVKKLNKEFRGKDKPTNVLSFPSSPEPRTPNPDPSLGDIILARQTVVREAREQGKKPRDHAIHLIVHGMLHLQGYDHESQKDAEKMELVEIKILKKLGISNPYL